MGLNFLFARFFRASIQDKKGISTDDLCFSLLLALISTVLSYKFAVGNQLEQLPIIARQISPSYLTNDFFLSTTEEFGPRTYFILFVGFFCKFFPIPWVYVGLTFLSDLALVGVTLWAARRVIGANRLGASLSAVMVLGLASFHLGDATQIRYEIFQPASLAIPGSLLALVMGFKGQPIYAAIFASISSLPHPLYGAECGGLSLGVAFLTLLMPPSNKYSFFTFLKKLNWARAFKNTLPGVFILGGCLTIFWWLPYQQVNSGGHLPLGEFYNILVTFRAPHHYLPSHFRLNDFVALTFFLIAMGVAFNYWFKTVPYRTSIIVFILLSAVLVCCLIASYFSEILPVRAVLTLQLFRLLFIIKWLGFLLFGAVFSHFLLQSNNTVRLPLTLISLFSTGTTQPLLTSLSFVVFRYKPWSWVKIKPTVLIVLFVIFSIFLWFLYGDISEFIFLVFAYILVIIFMLDRAAFGAKVFSVALISALIIVLTQFRGLEESPDFVPVFDHSDQHNSKAMIARALLKVTPEDALLITPPEFGIVRVIGERALVVDFKSIPFQDQSMKKWYERIVDVYGHVSRGGFKAAKELDAAYKSISDKKLKRLGERYGANFAVLYKETKSLLPVVYTDEVYKVVQLP